MLGLKLPTDPRWVNIVEENIPTILTDHAYCEMKAASYANSLILKYPEKTEMVDKLSALVIEETEHFRMVFQKIQERGLSLGRESKDRYVHDLLKFVHKGGRSEEVLCDRLLIAAMIEARSCERFRVLSENIQDQDLASFYHDLMASEARHYTMFISFARKYCTGIDVEARWQAFLDYEAGLMENYGKEGSVHG
jgi:tRNA 2-(methylsulfanyl)-N6-isopentenyladenosine37 hydroxylase